MQNKSQFIFISEMQPIFERKLKDSANLEKDKIFKSAYTAYTLP